MKIKEMVSIVAAVALLTSFSSCKGNNDKNGKLTSILDSSMENTFLKTENEAVKFNDEIYTTHQVSGRYNETNAVPTDSVMAYITTSSNISSVVSSYIGNYKQVDIMVPNGRDTGGYYIDGKYDGKTHYDIVQKDISGSYKQHSTGTYYIHPDDGFNHYLADICIQAIAAGAKDIYIEEPDGYMDACYSDYFKTLWKENYGVDYQYNEDDLFQPEKQNAIVAKMFVDSYSAIAQEIKASYPNSKVYIATHSITSYSSSIIANNGAIVGLPEIDGVIGQSWTNTSMVPTFYNGAKETMYYERGYLEYSELAAYVNNTDKKVFLLNDAKADGGYDYAVTRPIWENNIVSAMMNTEVNCYESGIWPERSFGGASEEYKAVQEGIYRMQSDVHNHSSSLYGGTSGIGVLTSYTASSSFINAADSVSALCVPLIREGMTPKVITQETLSSVDDLKGIDILIMSYDFMKPTDNKYADVISSFVKAGGTLVYVGGYNYGQLAEGVWKDLNFNTPQDLLFNKLGLGVNSFEQYSGNKSLYKSSIAPAYFVDDTNLNGTKYCLTEYSVENANVLYTAENHKTICFEKSIGNGEVLVCGVEARGMSGYEGAYQDLYEIIIKRACDLSKKQYQAPEAVYAIRGNYEFYHTFDRTLTLDGTFVNMFSDTYEVVVNPIIPKETSCCYRKINHGESGIIYGSGEYSAYEDLGSKLSYSAINVLNSKSVTVVKLPQGSGVKNVIANYATTGLEPKNFSYTYNNETSILTVFYSQNRSEKINVNINIE